MKAVLLNGKTIEGDFTSMTGGYVARSIEIEPGDIKSMLRLLSIAPDHLRAHLHQLNARFESQRIGAKT